MIFENSRKSDVGKTTKNTPSERTYFSRYPSPKIIKIGLETMEKSKKGGFYFFRPEKIKSLRD